MSTATTKELTQLTGLSDIADFFETSTKRLQYHLYWKPKAYQTFTIPKRAGGERLIESPPLPVLLWQKRLAEALSSLYTRKATAFGFIPGRSVVDNARNHLGGNLVLNIDLSDFFHSIHFGRVYGVFQHPPFSLPANVAAVLAHLCCHNKRLPQGAPTSPMMSNFVCRGLDSKLSRYAKNLGARYSRYADDITFSTKHHSFSRRLVVDVDAVVLADDLVEVIANEGFGINDEKTRLMGPHVRQEVTGIKVNERLNVRWDYVRSLRGALHCWDKHGYDRANQLFQTKYDDKVRSGPPPELERHLDGKLAYLAMVRGPNDPIVGRYLLQFARLAGRRHPLSGAAALERRNLREAVWLVRGYDAEGLETHHGTAVFVEGIGFVTNYHVVDGKHRVDSEVVNVERFALSHPDINPSDEFDVTVAQHDKHLDLAVLDSNAKPWGSLVRASGPPMDGENVVLAGLANWHPGTSCRVVPTAVTMSKIANARRLFQLACTIQSGDSGGPILDSSGRVAGIATYNHTSTILANGCVGVNHLPL